MPNLINILITYVGFLLDLFCWLVIKALWSSLLLKSIGYSNLTKLSLFRVYIQDDTAFENLTNLKHLTLFDFSARSCALDISKQMPNLQSVRLSKIEFRAKKGENFVGSIIGFDKLAKLEKIEIFGSNI